MSPRLILKLVFLSFLSLAPILARDRLRTMIHPSVTRPSSDDKSSIRRNWTQDLRSKIRLASGTSSRSRDRTPSTQLHVLIQEKRALDDSHS